MLCKYGVYLFVCFLYLVKCDELIKRSANGLDALSNRLKNRFCKSDFTIRFKVLPFFVPNHLSFILSIKINPIPIDKVISNDRSPLFKTISLHGIDIELLQIYKGFYNESREYNYYTKLYSQSVRPPEGEEAGGEDQQCTTKTYISSLIVNQVYVLIGNFNEGRLFFSNCDYLRRLDLMRSKDLNLLRSGISCTK